METIEMMRVGRQYILFPEPKNMQEAKQFANYFKNLAQKNDENCQRAEALV